MSPEATASSAINAFTLFRFANEPSMPHNKIGFSKPQHLNLLLMKHYLDEVNRVVYVRTYSDDIFVFKTVK